MTVRDWIGSQSPPPPSRLAGRLSAALSAADRSTHHETPRVLLDAATGILRQSIQEPNRLRSRSAALDLLAADALITYALEAAADDCDSFVAQTDEMIRRLSSVVIDSTESK